MKDSENNASNASKKLRTAFKVTLAASLFITLTIAAILAWSEMMTHEPDDVSIIERYQILGTLPKEKGEIKTLDSGTKIKRINKKRTNELPYLNAMGGISAKWALIDGKKEYELYLTFDDLPRAIVCTIFHPEHFKEFYDCLGGDKDIASIVKQADKYGFDEIRGELPEYEAGYFERNRKRARISTLPGQKRRLCGNGDCESRIQSDTF